MDKEKRVMNVPAMVLLTIGGIVLILIFSFFYLSVNGKNYTSIYTQKLQSGEIKNPITEFQLIFSKSSSEEIPTGSQVITIPTEDGEKRIIIQADLGNLDVSSIQKELVNYLSIVLKLYNLHEIPFTSITPKVQVEIDENIYYAEISKGNIIIKEGKAEKPDITIKTTNEEVFKIIENKDYAQESIASGNTNIEVTKDYFVLFSKGYLKLYNEFNDWNLTSKVILSVE
ncbi:MAG: hypothetical protein AABW47_04275 [Nanoarchaeota archaeon]